MTNNCTFPLCERPEDRQGFCFLHAKHFAGVKVEKKKEPIAKQSDKRKEVQKEYKKIVKEFAAKSNRCEIQAPGCTGKMEGLHHIVKRSPANLLEKTNLLRSCNSCNTFLENNDSWAREKGFVKSKFNEKTGSKNKPPTTKGKLVNKKRK